MNRLFTLLLPLLLPTCITGESDGQVEIYNWDVYRGPFAPVYWTTTRTTTTTTTTPSPLMFLAEVCDFKNNCPSRVQSRRDVQSPPKSCNCQKVKKQMMKEMNRRIRKIRRPICRRAKNTGSNPSKEECQKNFPNHWSSSAYDVPSRMKLDGCFQCRLSCMSAVPPADNFLRRDSICFKHEKDARCSSAARDCVLDECARKMAAHTQLIRGLEKMLSDCWLGKNPPIEPLKQWQNEKEYFYGYC